MNASGPVRAAGILLHPTSLPGPHGVGDMGDGAFRFVDYLVTAGQQLWQVLPLGPTGFGNSPYAARSAFAGNPLLISLERVRDAGLLTAGDLDDAPGFDADRVDFEGATALKLARLRRAYGRLLAPARAEQACRLWAFRAEGP